MRRPALCLALTTLVSACGDSGAATTETGAGTATTGDTTPTSNGESATNTPTDDSPTSADTSASDSTVASDATMSTMSTMSSTSTADTDDTSTSATTEDTTTDTNTTDTNTSDTTDTTTGGSQPNCGDRFECTGETLWSKRIGNDMGPASTDSTTAVVVAPNGEITVAGSLQGTIDFGAGGVHTGPNKAYLARLTTDGAYVWARELASEDGVEVRSLGRDDAGNITLGGSVSGDLEIGDLVQPGDSQGYDAFVASFTDDGELRFAEVYGADSVQDRGIDLAVAADGTYALAGDFRGHIDFGGNQLSAIGGIAPDLFVAVFESDGAHRWSRRFGDDGTQMGLAIAFTAGGDVVAAASNYKTIDFGGQPLETTGAGAIALARLDAADGQPAWARQFESAAKDDLGYASLAADEQHIWLATYDATLDSHSVDFGGGPVDGYFFLLALDASGDTQWVRGFDALRGVASVVRDGGDSVIIVGAAEGTLDLGGGPVMTKGQSDAFVAKYGAADGEYRWSRIVGDYDQKMLHQSANDVGFDAEGHLYVGGSFGGSINWGDQELISGAGFGGLDGFLVKLLP